MIELFQVDGVGITFTLPYRGTVRIQYKRYLNHYKGV
jgi:hypothetical protein